MSSAVGFSVLVNVNGAFGVLYYLNRLWDLIEGGDFKEPVTVWAFYPSIGGVLGHQPGV